MYLNLRAPHQLLSCTLILMLSVTMVTGKGSSGDDDGNDEEVQTYDAQPRDPWPLNSSYVQTVPAANVTLIEYTNLGYYEMYYRRYHTIVGQNNLISGDGVCVNYATQVQNGDTVGIFNCPLPFEPEEFTSCCGEPYVEFCCLPAEFLDDVEMWRTYGDIMFFIVVVFVAILVPGLWHLNSMRQESWTTKKLNFLRAKLDYSSSDKRHVAPRSDTVETV